MAKLIRENIEDINVLTEATEGSDVKKYYVEGIFIQGNSPNKNRRIYPMAVLEKEVGRYVKESINENRALGELGHPCLDNTAEVLTENRGWQLIKDLIVGENVYTLEPYHQTIELQPVNAIHINHYKGKMINIKNRMFNTTVTPYHNFLTYYRDGNPYTITAGEIKEFIDTNISKLSKFAIPKVGDYKNKSPLTINKFGYDLNFKYFVAFMALYLSEGSVSKRKDRKDSYKLSITQNKGIKEQKIDELLSNLPFKYKKYETMNKYSYKTKCVWTFDREKELAEYLIQFGKSYEKYIDQEIIDSLDQETSLEFLRWYILGDGRGDIDITGVKCDVFSTSKKMIDDLSIVVVKSGHTFKMYDYVEQNDIVIENRIIKAESKRKMYFLQILKSEYIWLDKRHITISEIDWDDNVYCISTNNSNFLVKHNGYSYWSGNCGPTINLDRVSHQIMKLTREGNDYIGKAKILDTPNGRIVESFLKEKIKIGMSTRAMGSLVEKNGIMEVQDDLRLATAGDFVADPSAHKAFVNGIMENAEWVYDLATDSWKAIDLLEQTRKAGKILNEEEMFKVFKKFISNITK